MSQKIEEITVIGTGHGDKAMSAHLALMGTKVVLFNRTWKNVEALAARGGVFVKSNKNVHGFGEMAQVTSDIEMAVKTAN